MKLQLAAVIATALLCGTAFAADNTMPSGSSQSPMSGSSMSGGAMATPSDMKTQKKKTSKKTDAMGGGAMSAGSMTGPANNNAMSGSGDSMNPPAKPH